VAIASLDLRRYKVLAVDDEPENLEIVRFHFRDDFDLSLAKTPEEALEKLAREEFAVVVTDQRMPKKTGLELLVDVKRVRPRAIGVIVSAYSDLEVILAALNSGAVYRYVLKPWKREELFGVLRGAIERYAIADENQRLVERLKELNAYLDEENRPANPIGLEGGLRAAGERALQVAPTNATALLLGESGTGKEVFARFIHENSPRRQGPFIRVNAAALSPTLLESELFGHKKGAFTDAIQDRPGRFELASGGTLFLDEIGELPLQTQVKLLRVLQEREIERVGDATTVPIDVRLICATHRDLVSRMSEGLFREDLYYRINVFPISIPALRDRPADILPLAEHMLRRLRARVGRGARLGDDAAKLLVSYRWPGNVRELENVLERAMILSGGEIDAPLLTRCLGGPAPAKGQGDLDAELEEVERQTLLETLARSQGSKKRAAELLGISRSTLYYRLHRVGLIDRVEDE
jgi:DNA-binding NtrC family response regulator